MIKESKVRRTKIKNWKQGCIYYIYNLKNNEIIDVCRIWIDNNIDLDIYVEELFNMINRAEYDGIDIGYKIHDRFDKVSIDDLDKLWIITVTFFGLKKDNVRNIKELNNYSLLTDLNRRRFKDFYEKNRFSYIRKEICAKEYSILKERIYIKEYI